MKRCVLFCWGIVSFFVVVISFSSCQQEPQLAELVFKNGNFYTVNKAKPFCQAIAVKGDRLLAVGNDWEMDRYVGKETRIVDLKGKFGCPGFNDAHLHFLSGGKAKMEVNLTGVSSVREIQKRILEALRRHPPGEWLLGRGWDQTLLPGKQWPTKKILDIIAPDVPIYLLRVCGHVAWVNSKALDIAGIEAGTPNPLHGEIVKDPCVGEPSGILKEEAMRLVSQYIPASSEERLALCIKKALDEARRFGITSVQDYSSEAVHPIYERFYQEGELTCRISLWFPLQENLERYHRLRTKYSGTMLHFGLLKGFIDGSMGSQTAYFFKPYFDNPATRGIPQMTQEALNRLVLHADKEGFQIGIHAIGDAGNRMVLNAYDLAEQVNGCRDRRHRIEHAQVLTAQDIPRFKTLGVIPSMQPVHCIEDMRWAEKRIGRERCRYAYGWRSLKKRGAVLAFGTDWPVAPLNPLLGLYAAVTRRDTLGMPTRGWNPQERLRIEEAIEAYTLGSAYAEFMEREKGSLEPGKLADVVILDQNLLRISSSEILKTRVMYTIVGGKIVYQRE